MPLSSIRFPRQILYPIQPLDNHGWEWRCYMRDADGYLVDVGQYTQMALDHFKNDASEVTKQLHS